MSRIYRGCQNVLESRNNAQKTNTAAIRYITCTDNWLARSNKNIIQFNCHSSIWNLSYISGHHTVMNVELQPQWFCSLGNHQVSNPELELMATGLPLTRTMDSFQWLPTVSVWLLCTMATVEGNSSYSWWSKLTKPGGNDLYPRNDLGMGHMS